MTFFANPILYYKDDDTNLLMKVTNTDPTPVQVLAMDVQYMVDMVTTSDNIIYALFVPPSPDVPTLEKITPLQGTKTTITLTDIFPGEPRCLALSPNEQTLYIGYADVSNLSTVDIYIGQSTGTYALVSFGDVTITTSSGTENTEPYALACDHFFNVYASYRNTEPFYGRKCPANTGTQGSNTVTYSFGAEGSAVGTYSSVVCDSNDNVYMLAYDLSDEMNPIICILRVPKLDYNSGTFIANDLIVNTWKMAIDANNTLFVSDNTGLYSYTTNGVRSPTAILPYKMVLLSFLPFPPQTPSTPLFSDSALFYTTTNKSLYRLSPTNTASLLSSFPISVSGVGNMMALSNDSNNPTIGFVVPGESGFLFYKYNQETLDDLPLSTSIQSLTSLFRLKQNGTLQIGVMEYDFAGIQPSLINLSSGLRTFFGPSFSGGFASGVDSNNNLWIGNTSEPTIQRINLISGTITSFQVPSIAYNILFDRNDVLFVACYQSYSEASASELVIYRSVDYVNYEPICNMVNTLTSAIGIDQEGHLYIANGAVNRGITWTLSNGNFLNYLEANTNVINVSFPPPSPPAPPEQPVCLCPPPVYSKPNLFGSYNQPGWSNSNAYKYSTLVSLRAATGQTTYVNNPLANGYCGNQTLEQTIGNKGGYQVAGYKSSRAPPRNRFG
jgi:hypothetical protein